MKKNYNASLITYNLEKVAITHHFQLIATEKVIILNRL